MSRFNYPGLREEPSREGAPKEFKIVIFPGKHVNGIITNIPSSETQPRSIGVPRSVIKNLDAMVKNKDAKSRATALRITFVVFEELMGATQLGGHIIVRDSENQEAPYTPLFLARSRLRLRTPKPAT